MNSNCKIKPITRRTFLQSALAFAAQPALAAANAHPAPENDAKPTLYFIATAHNDTQWNWTVQDTIGKYIPDTVRKNDALFDQFPHYNFNYEGAIHYKFCKEYHPELFAIIKKRVAEGRWKIAGSWINAVDTHIPSAESLFRQALYGQQFFRQEFGKVSRDLYLPDCFGFPAHLPTIATHSGLIAFSTQKLTWGCWIKAPFAVGKWEGVDGSSVVASLRPGAYITKVHTDPMTDKKWQDDFADAGGHKVDLRYFGTGDRGGAPDIESVKMVNDAVADKNGPIRVLNTSSDQLALDLTPAQIAALPTYKGELLLRLHAVGCYTSQAAMKKWNRANEQLADAAERVCVVAHLFSRMNYPGEQLRENWIRFLWHQFHDDVTGTCIPQAYTFSWNDELIALNGFASALTSAISSLAPTMNTYVEGTPLIVYNALALARRDTVLANVTLPKGKACLRVFDPATKDEVPAQILSQNGDTATLLWDANVKSVALKVFDVRPSDTPCRLKTGLSITANTLENARIKVKIDANGDISSLYDKKAKREMLASPARIELLENLSPDSPAWEILYKTVTTPPRAYLDKPKTRIAETGPARIALEIRREIDGSVWTQTLRLTPTGETLEVLNQVDWKTPKTLVKAAFHTTASNPKATFDLDLGVVERANSNSNLWEVPAHQWADLTDKSGSHGLAILNDCKYGWDKPDDDILRHTLLHTPFAGQNRRYQGVQDIGKHEFIYALAPHAGRWQDGKVPLLAARLNQPLLAFHTRKHGVNPGYEISMLQVNTEQVSVRAFKRAEDSDEIVIRVQELEGKAAENVEIEVFAGSWKGREINAAEEEIAPMEAKDGKLRFSLTAYQPRSFALKIPRMTEHSGGVAAKSIPLPFNRIATTSDSDRRAAAFDNLGRSIPAELLPQTLTVEYIPFDLGGTKTGEKNMLACGGQRIAIPKDSRCLYLLACAVGGDTDAEFLCEKSDGSHETTKIRVQNWTRHVGQWYSTLEGTGADGGKQIVKQTKEGTIEGLEHLKPAFVKRDTIAWVGSHRHVPEGDEPHVLCYLFKYAIPLNEKTKTLVLPNNDAIRLFAISAETGTYQEPVTPAYPLYAADLP